MLIRSGAMARRISTSIASLLTAAAIASTLDAQQPAAAPPVGQPPSLAITIPAEPKAVDGTKLLPAPFTKPLTVAFENQPLADVVRWLRDDLKLQVAVDEERFAAVRVNDRLADQPLPLLLGRLASVNIGWFLEEGVLHLVPHGEANARLVLVRYNLGPLLDAGFEPNRISETLRRETNATWKEEDWNAGTTVLVGDILFVKQRQSAHIEIAALLSALEQHGRRTLLFDPSWKEPLLAALKKPLTVQFDDVPLGEAIRQLGRELGTELRIDTRIPAGDVERAPVKYAAADQTLPLILDAIAKPPLGFELRSGAIWVIPRTAQTLERTTAVYDVRDLCLDFEESNALRDAIRSQVRGPWDGQKGQSGSIAFPKPGVLVVRQSAAELDEISTLLEDFRFALRASKPRGKAGPDLKKVELRIYRVPAEMAVDVEKLVLELVAPDSWEQTNAGQPGTIRRAVSQTKLEKLDGPTGPAVASQNYAALLIRQTVENHQEIAALLQRLETGDPPVSNVTTPKREGIGGFGRGFFQNPR